MDGFTPFGWMHLICLIVSAVGWFLVVRVARLCIHAGWERPFRRVFGALILVTALAWAIHWAMRDGAVLKYSLPLQACDIAWMAAAFSILTGGDQRRLRHQLLYYWAFGFSSWAYLTPSLESGPASPLFWQFWIAHWFVLAGAFINMLVFGVRPSWRGFLETVAVTLAITAAVTALNLALDTSYFFTGRYKPRNPTLLDLLGPWPLRIVWMVLIGTAIFAALTLPAGFRRRKEQ